MHLQYVLTKICVEVEVDPAVQTHVEGSAVLWTAALFSKMCPQPKYESLIPA